MATSKIQVTEGSGKNVATNSFSEDAVTKEVQRIVLNNSSGTEIATTTTPAVVEGKIASGATDSGNPVKTGGKYNSTAPTLTDGQRGDTQLDANSNTKITAATTAAGEDLANNVQGTLKKPVASATYAPSISAIFGSDVDVSAKITPGNILSFVVTNINAAVRYFHIHNKATAPASSDAPILSLPIPAGTATAPGYLEIGANILGEAGIYCSTGVAYGVSTVNATFTAATTTDHNEFVTFI